MGNMHAHFGRLEWNLSGESWSIHSEQLYGITSDMNDRKEEGFVLSKRVSCLANITFILIMFGTIVYSFVVPKFGLSWGWIVIVMLPIWAIIMANISAG